MRRVMLGGLVALVLVAGACGGDDDDGADSAEESSESGEANASGGGDEAADESTGEAAGGGGGDGSSDDYVAAYTTAFSTLGTTEEESACMASALVDTIGVDKLNELTTPETVSTSSFDPSALGLDATSAGALYDGLNGCADMLNVLVSAGGASEIADCLRQNLDEATVKTVLVASFTGDTAGMAAAQGELTEAYNTCNPTASMPVAPTTLPSG